MATLIFAQAKSIRKKVKDALALHERCESGVDPDRISNSIIETQRHEFREILKIAQLLHSDYEEIVSKKTTNWYFITVRPRPGVEWKDFYILTYKFVNRAFMLEYKLSFEQKSNEGNGEGFHVHIVCNTKHRSKGEILRDTQSTFAKVCDNNCVDVKPTRNPEDIVNNYLLEYKSDDDHKAGTQQGDQIWRAQMGLKDLYINNLPEWQQRCKQCDCYPCECHKAPGLLSSSPRQQQISDTRSGPIIIEMN